MLLGGVSSALAGVECHRTLDRLSQQGVLDPRTLRIKRSETNVILKRIELIPISDAILDVASDPLPAPLGTLDAIHLASALAFRTMQRADERPIAFATHDRVLARAARAMHFDVIGSPE